MSATVSLEMCTLSRRFDILLGAVGLRTYTNMCSASVQEQAKAC